jgi:hypothetical protein
MPCGRGRPETDGVDDEITCERCGSRIRLTLAATGWPMLADAAAITDVHADCLRAADVAPSG